MFTPKEFNSINGVDGLSERQMKEHYKLYEGYMACGIGIWFSFQTVVNVGAAAGMLPTKGLTLPLVSYGGSSLIAITMAVAIWLRIDFERRLDTSHVIQREAA